MSNLSPYSKGVLPGYDIIPVTPSDTVDIDECRALYVSVSGNVKIVTASGETRGPIPVVAGLYLFVRCTRVFSTDTTATVWAVY